MSTWKKYGGIDKFDKTNHMTVDSMVANYFTIRKQIIGDIDISGNLAVRKRLDVYEDASFNNDMSVSGSVDIGKYLDVAGNITTNANLTAKGDILVYRNLYFNSDRKVYMNGTPDGIGVNTNKPLSQFDITSDLESVLSVKTSQPTTENVIARNNADKGIVVKSDLSSATIDFFCDSSMISSTFPYLDSNGRPQLDVQLNYNNYDARIKATNDGSLTIDASSNIQLLAQTIITENSSKMLNNNSSLSVYNDKINDVYLEDIYDNSAAYVSDGISLISVDGSSSIFMKMVSRTNDQTSKGFAVAGGAFPGDTTRAMGSLGCLDNDGNYIPNQTIVSGNNSVKLKTTLGINKYMPSTDIQVLDINGPVRINNGEITPVQNTSVQCTFLSFCRDNVNYGISAGAPYTSYADSSYADQSYWESQIYYTHDAGMNWNTSSMKVTGTYNSKTLNAGFVYDSSYAFIYGNDGTGFYTINGGISWINKSFNATSTDVKAVYIAKNVGNADCRFFMTYDGTSLRYYDAKIGSTSSNYVYYNGSSDSIVITNTGVGYTINSINFNAYNDTDTTEYINTVHGYGSYIYCAGSNIYKYDANTTITTSNYINKYIPSSNTYSYNTIYAYDDNYVVAAGVNIISYTLNGGDEWTDIVFTTSNTANVDGINTIYSAKGESFQSIHIYDGSNALVVGTNSSMYYTNNGTLWKKVPDNLLDAAGNRSVSYGDSNVSLNGVYCIDKNSFITTRIVEEYNNFNNPGSSKIFYNYFPNLLNRNENTVFDMCGNMNIFGDINIQDNGNITSNGTTFYLVNDSVQDIYFGGDASSIQMGDSSGSTTINHYLYVDKDLEVVNGDFYLPNTAYINIADISGLHVYDDTTIDGILTVGNRVIIENDASITVDDTSGAPLYVAGGSHFEGNVIMSNTDSLLYVNGTTRLMGDLYTENNIYINSTNTTDQYTVQINSGNVFLNNNMDISGNLEVMDTLFSRNTTRLGGNTYISGNVLYENTEVSYVNVTIDNNTTYNPSIINFSVENWDDLVEEYPISMATRAYVDASLNKKATIASPVFTGIPTAPTAAIDVSSTQLATTAFVKNQYYLQIATAASTYAPIYNADLSGVPTAPTANTSTNTSQIATTAYVKNVISNITESITLTTLDNTWTGNNIFNNDVYIHGARFGTMDGSSIVIGNNSLSSSSTGIDNIAVGRNLLVSNTSGTNNIAVGTNSLISATTGANNIAIGAYNGYNVKTGSRNTIIGYQSLYNNKTGGNNVALGSSALYNNNDGSYNIAIGYNAGYSDTSGSYNTYLGVNTNTSGNFSYSTAIGYGANITANSQVVLGSLNDYIYIPSVTTSTSTSTGALIVGGGIGVYGNVNVGKSVGISGTTRSFSTTTGALVVSGGVGISGNVYIGGTVDITGNTYAPTASSSENSRMVATTAYVTTAITNLRTSENTWTDTNSFSKNIYANGVVLGKYGSNNYVMGMDLPSLTTNGSYNTIMGPNCMTKITTGSHNIGVGNQSLNNLEPGSYNIGIGNYALNEAVDNNNNCAIGYYALNTTLSNNNTAFGSYAGNNNISGVNNTYIGYNTGASSYNYAYSTAIGYSASITGNNQIVLGTSGEYVSIPGTTTSTSSTSGALVVTGGIGVGGNVYVGGAVYVNTDVDPSDNSTQLATTSYVQTSITNRAFNTLGDYTWTGTNVFSQNITVNDMPIGNYGSSNYSIGTNFGNIDSGSYNVGVGPSVLTNNRSGSNNIAIGNKSLELTTSDNNTAIGTTSGNNNTSGQYNSFLGYNSNTSGNYSYSTAIGYSASITENNQIVLGTSGEYVYIPGTTTSTTSTSGALVVTGGIGVGGNVYVGGAVYVNTDVDPSDNSTQLATTSYVQTSITNRAFNTLGDYTWTGTNVFSQNITVNDMPIGNYGSSNYSIGTNFGNIDSGSYNVGVGPSVLTNNRSGSNNIAIGNKSLESTTSDNNTAIGSNSGNSNTSGQYNSFLGYNSNTSGTYSYSTAIGQYATISANNQVVLGTSSEYIYIPGTTVSTSSTTGALVVSGGAGVAGNVYVGGNATIVGNVDVCGNLYTITPSSSDNSNKVATTAYVQNAISGISGSSSVSLSSTNTWTSVNTFGNATASTSTDTGALVVSGGVGIAGNVYVGGNISTNGAVISRYGTTSSNYSFGNIITSISSGGDNINIGDSLTSITSGSFNIVVGSKSITSLTSGSANTAMGYQSLTTISTNTYNTAIGYRSGYASSGSYNTYLGSITTNSSGYNNSTCIGYGSSISASNQIALGTTGDYVYIPGTKVSTSSTTGALVVSGGVGIAGNIYVGGNATIVGNVDVCGNLYTITPSSSDNSNKVATTAYVQSAISGISGSSSVSLSSTNTWTSVNTFSNATASTSTGTGALVVSGGVGIAGNVNIGGNIAITGNVSTATKITNSTKSTTTSTGALIVSGGVGVSGNVNVGGSIITPNLSIAENIKIGENTLLSVTTALFNLAIGQNSLSSLSSDCFNTGIGYNSGLNLTGGESNTFIGTSTSATGTYSFSTAIGQNATITASRQIVLGTVSEYVYIPSTTTTSSTTAGALVVSGGVGISGNVYVGGNISVAANVISATKITNSTSSTTTSSGALVVSGGVGIAGNVNMGGIIKITNSTSSTNSSSGALVVTGGIGVGGNVYALSYLTSSDYRIKDNIIPLDGNFTVDNLNPVHYYNKLADCSDIGFLAHEVQQEYPYLVHGEKDGNDYQSLNYTGMIGILVNEIKVLKKENAMMKEEIQHIKNLL